MPSFFIKKSEKINPVIWFEFYDENNTNHSLGYPTTFVSR